MVCLHDYAIHYAYTNYYTKLHKNGQFGEIVFMEFTDLFFMKNRMAVDLWMYLCIKLV